MNIKKPNEKKIGKVPCMCELVQKDLILDRCIKEVGKQS